MIDVLLHEVDSALLGEAREGMGCHGNDGMVNCLSPVPSAPRDRDTFTPKGIITNRSNTIKRSSCLLRSKRIVNSPDPFPNTFEE